MDLIVLSDGLYQLIPVTKQMVSNIDIVGEVDLFSLCDVLRNELTTYLEHINRHVMKDGGGFFYGCIQN
jgi:hypothetical protein